jgi:hypothetical protein
MLKKAKLNIYSDIENLDQYGLHEGETESTKESFSSSFLRQGNEFRMS